MTSSFLVKLVYDLMTKKYFEQCFGLVVKLLVKYFFGFIVVVILLLSAKLTLLISKMIDNLTIIINPKSVIKKPATS